jgi:CelD/BcsL family acetyltransferase involved in cellulose biosynthesis
MIILDLDDQRWSEFVRSCPDASPFHHPAWIGLLSECYRYRPLVLALTDDAGQITAGLPIMDVSGPLTARRWISLPFTDYCPVLTKGQSLADVGNALVGVTQSHRLTMFELRAALPKQRCLYTRTAAVRHTLALSLDPSTVYSRFTKMHQRNIRKAERAGVRIEHGRSAADVQTFYRMHLLTRQRLGVPIQPRRFFHLLAHHIVESGLGFVLSAQLNHVPVAAAIFLAWNGVLIYKYGASDPRFWEYRPNNLLFWEAIKWGCENGYGAMDWGRTDLDDSGLRQFKNGWGAEEEPLIYSVIANAPLKRTSNRLKQVMGVVIRRSPLWVCRGIGELFYRYAV